ncbi:CBS domain-containing protein [Pseudomonas straminea]|uniref:CBS domain-containing protein n=1 Tax=Pseudomonas straminea TaxID=47882 RepID=A0A1I1WB45_PSEOC|nr:CBS domain-containing protein [Pseudomonas straminea]GLX14737.1 CBS domain-containing protein [Pseudomonas straminea]SFD92332.1 CBS domain-containing protein [Pseudomonas straminea]
MSREERNKRLKAIKESLDTGWEVTGVSVRDFISWFGAERRGNMVSYVIRKVLKEFELETFPDFDTVPLDAKISFKLITSPDQDNDQSEETPDETSESFDDINPEATASDGDIETAQALLVTGALHEPAFRLSRLVSAHNKPVCVKPDSSLKEAVTLMLRHDFSQLPVMTNERDVKGIVSWESIGTALFFESEKSPMYVRECMVSHNEMPAASSIFIAIPHIVQHSYILVRDLDKTISGIITTADLSLQFKQLSEPFLLLAEIENHVRALIDGKFTQHELAQFKAPGDDERLIETVADLTFGEYIRIFENPISWAKTKLQIDRATFISELEKIRVIRNDVMHFDPDGMTPEKHELLTKFVHFIHAIKKLHSSP